MQKKDIRKDYLSKRQNLAEETALQYNKDILANFKAYSFEGIRFIHFYLPIKKFKEPNTYPLIEWLLAKHPQINIVLSKSNLKTHLMEHFLWDGKQELHTNAWGIDEPSKGTQVVPKQLDAVIMPLLAYDQTGHRVGYGKGFYDRFLSQCRPDCKRIGLSFFEPVIKIEDINEYDAPLDACITPIKTYFFN